MQVVSPAAVGVGRLLGRIEALDSRVVIATAAAISWLVTLVFALRIQHNGWLYYSGGDGTYYWTTPWALAHHLLPETVISYGLPVFTLPLAWIFGSSLLASLPVIVLVQVAVLGPIGIAGMYAIAKRLGGPLLAAAAALLWALSPFIAYHYVYRRFHEPFRDIVLPSVLGLNNLADYTSMVLAIVVAALVLRALDERRWNDVVLGGVLCGFLIAVKPANGFFVPAPIAAFLVARAWRQALAFAAAMLPALVTLTIWKQQGLGTVPLFGASAVHAAAPAGALGIDTSKYLPFHWSHFGQNLDDLREATWSLRLAEFVPLAGIVGAARRGLPYATLLGLWCLDYLVVKGGTPDASVSDWSYFRFTMPGFPAYVLLACCTVFLVPGAARRRRPSARSFERLRWSRGLVVTAAVFALYPLLVVVTHGRPAGNRVVVTVANNVVPVTDDLHFRVVQTRTGQGLRWRQPSIGSTSVQYALYRGKTTGCPPPSPPQRQCHLTMPLLGTGTSHFLPGSALAPGIYRLGLVAGQEAGVGGDLLLLSPPVRVR